MEGIIRLPKSELREEADMIMDTYLKKQSHESLLQLFSSAEYQERQKCSLIQVMSSPTFFLQVYLRVNYYKLFLAWPMNGA